MIIVPSNVGGLPKTKLLALELGGRRIQVINTDSNTLESPAIYLPTGAGTPYQMMLNRSKTKLCILSSDGTNYRVVVLNLGIGFSDPAVRNAWPDANYYPGDTVRSVPNFTFWGDATGTGGYEVFPGPHSRGYTGFYVSENFAYVFKQGSNASDVVLTRVSINSNTVTDNYYRAAIVHNNTGETCDGLRSGTGGYGLWNDGVMGVTGVGDDIFVIMANSIVRISDSAGGQPTHFSRLDTGERSTPIIIDNILYRRTTGDNPQNLTGYSLVATNSVDTWTSYQWSLYSTSLPTYAPKVLNATLLPTTARVNYSTPVRSLSDRFFIQSGTQNGGANPGTYKGDIISPSNPGARLYALSHPAGSGPSGFGNYAQVNDLCADYKNEKIYFVTTDQRPGAGVGGDGVAANNGVGCFNASTGAFISKLTNTTATAANFSSIVAIPA